MKNIQINNHNGTHELNTDSNQLDLGLGSDHSARCTKPVTRRRHSHASLWFRRMRQIVDSARDWRPAPSPRPLQPLLGKALSQERQLTE